MYTTVTLHDFRNEFQAMNRTNSFTYEGYEALYEYLLDLEDAMGRQQPLDVIDLCCRYTEYDCWADYQEAYPDTLDQDDLESHVVAETSIGSYIVEEW